MNKRHRALLDSVTFKHAAWECLEMARVEPRRRMAFWWLEMARINRVHAQNAARSAA